MVEETRSLAKAGNPLPARRLLVAGVIACGLAATTVAQDAEEIPGHLRATWEGSASWPLIRPDEIQLDPERIVGVRSEFVFEQGLHTDSPVTERRIWEIDAGSHYGTPVLVLQQIDTGHQAHSEAFARHTTWYVERDSFSLKFILGADPLDTTQRVVRFGPDRVLMTGVTADGAASTITLEGEHRVHSYRFYPQILAAMDLEPGMQFRLTDFAFWDDSGISETDVLSVGEERTIHDAEGRARRVRVVRWRTGPFETQYFVGEEWPYYLGQIVTHDRVDNGRQPVYRETFVRAQRIR